MRRVAQWLLVLALSLSIGLQWAVLQSAAWVGMVVVYSKHGTLAESLTMTFSGRHPCKVCKAVQSAQDEQTRQENKPEAKELQLAAPEAEQLVQTPDVASIPTGDRTRVVAGDDAPATPPPERASRVSPLSSAA